ncbi:DUF2207 domain-containing protein [Planctomonas psychrotolerans]|uniref:DUF2207 domain-containing protein n=1 Tax=Planctomonas psychrotolerans TaxID=2528712 RepID=UPI001D0D46E6|nr:DUF2207 domain-containing protein [Planctomonas psychrotolerans]
MPALRLPLARAVFGRVLPALLLAGAALVPSVTAPLSAGAASPSTATAAYAAVRGTDDFRFSSFEADYYLERADDGSSRLRTVETLVAEFPERDQNRGIVRAIPTGYEGADVGLRITSVTDAEGNPVPFEEDEEDDFRVLALGTDEFVRGTQTYVLEYEQRNVTRSYDDTSADEFYWDTNGTGWDQPFGTVSARVHLTADLAGALTGNAACYVGGEGSADPCSIDLDIDDGGAVFTASADDLTAGENVTVAIGFEPGTFTEPARAKDAAWVGIVPGVLAALSAAVAVAAALVRRFRLRHAAGRPVIIPEYAPPRGITLLLAGDIVGRPSSALAAQLIDFAVRGIVRVVDDSGTPTDRDGRTEEPAPESDDSQYTLVLVRSDDIDDSEREVLTALFGRKLTPGRRRPVDDVDETMAEALHEHLSAVPRQALDRGLRNTPRVPARVALLTAAWLLIAVTGLVLVVLAVIDALVLPSVLLIGGTMALAVLAIVVLSSGPRLTPAGAEVRDHLLGLRDYLELAEADRFRMLQSPLGAERSSDRAHAGRVAWRRDAGRAAGRGSDASASAGTTADGGAADEQQVVRLYERLLPYAVLWGIEEQWAEELDRLYASSGTGPDWYAGPRPYNSASFVGLTGSLHAQATSVSATAWAASGGSGGTGGSMGGGFSGGGGGGGGGGGR